MNTSRTVQQAQLKLQRRIEQTLTLLPTVQCRPGCHACCDMPFTASWQEVLLALPHTSPTQLEAHQRRAERILSAAQVCEDETTFYSMYRAEAGPCAHLSGDGHCSIHPQRPGACRTLFSALDARHCAQEFTQTCSEEELQTYLSLNDQNPHTQGHTHYLSGFEREVRQYHQQLADAAFLDHHGMIFGDWSVLITMASDRDFRLKLNTSPKVQPILEGLLHTHPLYHPFLVSYQHTDPGHTIPHERP